MTGNRISDSEVLRVAMGIIADGQFPSGCRLVAAMPDWSQTTILKARQRLLESHLLRIPEAIDSIPRSGYKAGTKHPRTRIDELQARIEAVKAAKNKKLRCKGSSILTDRELDIALRPFDQKKKGVA